MKTVTQKFVDNLARPGFRVIRSVLYKRRYWNGSVYVWESSWTALNENKVVTVSPITAQLDTQQQNEFKTANVTVTLRNLLNEWKPQNPYGRFGPDSGSPTYGYEPYFMKFQIQAGLIYDDSTQELVTLMTGVVTELNFNTDAGTVQMTVGGEQQLLTNANAEAVSTTATLENIGTGNASTTVFFTAHNGVGIIKTVTVAGVTSRPGKDYTIGQLNDPNNPASITFVAAPAGAAAILCTYVYWQQGKKFETLVASLATQAGIAGGNQQITPVTYPNSITSTHVWQTQADWQGGSSLTNIDTTTLVNSIEVDFSSTGARQNTDWASATAGWTTVNSGGISIANGGLTISGNVGGSPAGQYRALSSAIGRWDINFKYVSGTSESFHWFPMANGIGSAGASVDTPIFFGGYAIKLLLSGSTWSIDLLRVDSDVSSTSLGSTTEAKDTSFHTLTFVRYPSGLMVVSYDGVIIISATDNTYTTGTYYAFTEHGGSVVACQTLQLYTPASTETGTWISSVFDSGSTPTAWTQFTYVNIISGGSISYLTASSADNITYDAYVAVGIGGVIGSTLRRYLKVKAVLISTLASANNPSVSNISVGSTSSSTVITLANFTGLTCHDAIQALAALANYEFGFDSVENFFFRPKTVAPMTVMSISSTNFIMAIVSTLTGNDQVYTAVRATYGTYISEVDDAAGLPVSPAPRIGFALIDVSGGSLLIPADADIATGIAQAFFAYYKAPRRKFKASVKFLPQLDLSDPVSLSFQDNMPTEVWYWGDPDVYWGEPSINYYGTEEQTLANLTGKVIGARIDTEAWMCEYDFEEVI